jgi:hypothetical protein
MSRVTLQRIEKGEASVTVGAWMSVAAVLGLDLVLVDPKARERLSQRARALLPREIRPDHYPQLEKLAWQIHRGQPLSPEEALELYERNWRHVDVTALGDEEREFLELLLEAFGRERLLV